MRSLYAPLFVAIFLSALSPGLTEAHALRGDWGSAGDLVKPWNPPYEFQYDCQAELTDGVDHVGDGRTIGKGKAFRLYAVSRFTLANGRTHWQSTSEVRWVAKLLDEIIDPDQDTLTLDRPPAGAFAPEGASAGLFFRPGTGGNDAVTLAASAKLPLGQYALTQTERTQSGRENETIQVRASALVSREKGQPASLPQWRERSLFVVCDKKK